MANIEQLDAKCLEFVNTTEKYFSTSFRFEWWHFRISSQKFRPKTTSYDLIKDAWHEMAFQ